MASKSTWLQRTLLPGFAFKAVVIGGGYATGRELVTFFMPSGPWGGLYGILLAMAVWSTVCAVTFLFALKTGSRDYRTFFSNLLGPLWPVFEIAFCMAIMVILAVFAAAAGAIGQAVLGWPALAGSLALIGAITLVATFGNEAVEQLFKYVSFFLYATYAVFLFLSLIHFGDRIGAAFAADVPATGWVVGGMTYAGYNIVGAAIILPVIRHLRGPKDAIVAGLLAGPLALLPAILFFVCMAAFYPEIGGEALPSDYLLARLNFPSFRLIFQAMIFAALLESGVGQVHAINERIAHAYQTRTRNDLSLMARLAVTVAILVGSIFVADRIGLVDLIANGYRWLAYIFLGLYVLPLMTIGLWRLRPQARSPAQEATGA
ncbi:putative membrane protein YkvI [Nitrospirillum iridis]|uniref:Putative membrane protein YkvI n=1 Tax=Nitrospirillum iridis TaxID=765888 RepID=A0A7X0B0X4_9PROT|nr:putative membrane protein YkvI [Nitrospirillum iridis]